MKLSLSWLKDFLDLNLPPQKIAETLTLAGIEVESVEPLELAFSGVVVAKVLEVAPHPNADKLCVAKVTDGTEELQIVCGAKNCRPGLITALAKIGATLKDAEGKVIKIKKGKLRDVESFGMLCGADELGLGVSEGIIEFSETMQIGTDLTSVYGNVIFEVSLTPNLGHCMSVLGVARELAAFLNVKMHKPKWDLVEQVGSRVDSALKVSIEDKAQCWRYCARVVKGVKVGPSLLWLKKKLEASGIRSINNVVDVSNYVMLEMGQPLHIFDYSKIEGKAIRVSSAPEFTLLTTLDDQVKEIPKHALMICDTKKPLAFAGIMGGADSAVTDATIDVVIESAYFTSTGIRKTAKAIGMRTDSAQRFEKGVDYDTVGLACDRAAALLREVAGGEVLQGMIDVKAQVPSEKKVTLRVSHANRLTGLHVSAGEISALLQRLGFDILKEEGDQFLVFVPSFRNDVTSEVDLIEEIARLYGFNHIPLKVPHHVSSTLNHSPMYLFEKEVREHLIDEGLQEFITCNLISPTLAELSLERGLKKENLVSVMHPRSVDQSVLRPSLLPVLLQAVKFNLDHQSRDVSAFEVGRIHFKVDERVVEQEVVGIVLTGENAPYTWDPKPRKSDFFDLKGIVENLFAGLKIGDLGFTESHLHSFHPGRQGQILAGEMVVGMIGEVHPNVLAKLDISTPVLFAEINLPDLISRQKGAWKVADLPLYPSSERDWTLTVKSEMPIAELIGTIQRDRSPLLEKVYLLDLYTSEQLGKDRKNATLRFTYRDKNKTISLETVEKEHGKITQDVAEKLRDWLL